MSMPYSRALSFPAQFFALMTDLAIGFARDNQTLLVACEECEGVQVKTVIPLECNIQQRYKFIQETMARFEEKAEKAKCSHYYCSKEIIQWRLDQLSIGEGGYREIVGSLR
jgi:hypothetical protein